MEAEIQELWDTGEEILNVHSFDELRKCDNVIVGKRDEYGYYEVLIDDQIIRCKLSKRQHPSGGGSLYVITLD